VTASLYIGLMSGTSMDGVDGVLVDFASGSLALLAHTHRPFEPAVRASLMALNNRGTDELHRSALAGNAVARAYAGVASDLLKTAGLPRSAVTAIGAHGQTVRHQPGLHDGTGYTIQLLNGALLAELTGVDVVCDFRSRDVAAGGQGAPLVPAFHRAMFAKTDCDVAVLNIGGIANLTLLHADGRTGGHDCGPGNVLLDLWCEQHTGAAFDANGDWGAGGRPIPRLLDTLTEEPFLHQAPPKSTGRDLFHRGWLHAQLERHQPAATTWRPQDVQATLNLFTARAACDDLQRWLPAATQLLVCGGGALNAQLLRNISALLPGVEVRPIGQIHPMDPMHVEAAAFAWLARAFIHHTPANCPGVTGAAGSRPLGALYPA
jgi:anhydro-N-acetylmuramic acid kinase